MKISINTKAYDEAIKKVIEFKEKLENGERELLKRLAVYGATRVEMHYAWVQYDDEVNIVVDYIAEQHKAVIRANGKAVAFVEFGAGVWYNDGESYPLPRPVGIVGIGEYGKGKGNNPKGWYFTNSKGQTSQFTKGNPANMGMYKTILELTEKVGEVAREVFKS